MKKRLVGLLLAVSMTTGLCACGGSKAEGEVSAEATSQVESQSAVESTTESSETSETEQKENGNVSAVDHYQAVAENQEKIKIAKDMEWISAGEYTLGEMVETCGSYLKECYSPDIPSAFSQAYVDCGLDGTKEWGVNVTYVSTDDSEPLVKTFVFACPDGTVELAGTFESYYRGYSSLNEAGIVQCGGSSGATTIGCDYYVVTSDAKTNYLYGFEEECLGEDAILPPGAAPCLYELPEWYEFNWEDVDGSNYLDIYRFEEYTAETDYDEYMSKLVYSIQNENMEDVQAPAEYMEYYQKNGLTFIDAAELQKRIEAQMDKYQVTQEMLDAAEPEWTDFSIVLPSREAALAKKSDLKSAEAQVQVIVDHMKDWILPEEDYTWTIRYMVTDLDRNGRLEIVSSKYNYYEDININRFYEITEDYTDLAKMDYDCETKWANGEESGWNPQLQSGMSVYCIINDMGKASENYNGPTYRYIIPTTKGYGEDFMENKIEMNVDNNGRVWTDSVGFRQGLDEPVYSDVNGLDCSEDEYQVMEFLYYDDDEYEEVRFGFISVNADETTETSYWNLLNSYYAFTHEAYTPDLSLVQ